MRRRYARRIRAGIAASRLPVLHQLLWLGNVADDLALRAYWRARNKHIRTTPDSGSSS